MSNDRFVGGLENIDGDLVAGGSISAGDLVELTGDNEVSAVSTAGNGGYGVAMYDAEAGDAVAVATAGAKVRISAGSSVAAGDFVTGSSTSGQVVEASTTGDEIAGQATVGESGGEAIVMIALGGEVN